MLISNLIKEIYIFIINLLFNYSSNNILNLWVSSKIASLSHSSYEIVVNFIEDLILLFSFLMSSSYFFKLFSNILVDKLSPAGLNLSLVRPLNPGVFALDGYYSSIFWSLTVYFYKVVILVLSFIFYDDKKLFFSFFKIKHYASRLDFPVVLLLFLDSC